MTEYQIVSNILEKYLTNEITFEQMMGKLEQIEKAPVKTV